MAPTQHADLNYYFGGVARKRKQTEDPLAYRLKPCGNALQRAPGSPTDKGPFRRRNRLCSQPNPVQDFGHQSRLILRQKSSIMLGDDIRGILDGVAGLLV